MRISALVCAVLTFLSGCRSSTRNIDRHATSPPDVAILELQPTPQELTENDFPMRWSGGFLGFVDLLGHAIRREHIQDYLRGAKRPTLVIYGDSVQGSAELRDALDVIAGAAAESGIGPGGYRVLLVYNLPRPRDPAERIAPPPPPAEPPVTPPPP